MVACTPSAPEEEEGSTLDNLWQHLPWTRGWGWVHSLRTNVVEFFIDGKALVFRFRLDSVTREDLGAKQLEECYKWVSSVVGSVGCAAARLCRCSAAKRGVPLWPIA
jgi:hypothetical protein